MRTQRGREGDREGEGEIERERGMENTALSLTDRGWSADILLARCGGAPPLSLKLRAVAAAGANAPKPTATGCSATVRVCY